MKLSAILIAAAGIASTASAQSSSSTAGSSAAATVAPTSASSTSSTASSSAGATTASSGTTTATVSGEDVFANLKTQTYSEDSYHMPPTVEACGSGNGCKRVGYSQLCTECTADEGCSTGGSGFEYPKLEKAYTTLSENETTTNLSDGSGKSSTASGSAAGSNSESAAAPLTFTVASVAVGLMTAVLAL
ncbi:hypothetical protein PC123_g6002 [Phytophthora cactorum]|nr:hypothetical protein PC123_g6002 [Phytophthora cactorum]